MEFNKPKIYTANVVSLKKLNKKVVKIDLKNISTTKFIYLPGQYISVQVDQKTYRSYSLYSDDITNQSFSIIAAIEHEGVGSNFLRGLTQGQTVNFIGPSGRFVLPSEIPTDMVFVATGTGISPILSMINYLAAIKKTSNITLYFGIRDVSELIMSDQIQMYAETFKNFKYTYCFSQSLPTNIANAYNGRVTGILGNEINPTADYFICGNPYMVKETIELLQKNNIDENKIHHENFTISQKG